jgi:hypothetical protein
MLDALFKRYRRSEFFKSERREWDIRGARSEFAWLHRVVKIEKEQSFANLSRNIREVE